MLSSDLLAESTADASPRGLSLPLDVMVSQPHFKK